MEKVVQGLLGGPGEDTSNVILDLLGFDAWPACYAMHEIAAGQFNCFLHSFYFVFSIVSCLVSLFPFNCCIVSFHLFLSSGLRFACSTACHSPHETTYCASAIGEKSYSMCRAGQLKLPGFPEFETIVTDLKSNNANVPMPEFQVLVPVPNGVAIKQNLVDYWLGCEIFQTQMADILKEHNEKYNPHGHKRPAEDESAASI